VTPALIKKQFRDRKVKIQEDLHKTSSTNFKSQQLIQIGDRTKATGYKRSEKLKKDGKRSIRKERAYGRSCGITNYRVGEKMGVMEKIQKYTVEKKLK